MSRRAPPLLDGVAGLSLRSRRETRGWGTGSRGGNGGGAAPNVCRERREGTVVAVRASGSIETARSLGPHDHVCWVYDDHAEFLAAMVEFLAEGRASHQRVQYIARGDRAVLHGHVDGLDGVGDTARGPVLVLSLDEVYQPGETVGPEAQVAAYRAATERALADGFTGLRVAAEATPLVRTPAQRAAFVRYEHMIDRYMVAHPFSALCGYDRLELGHETVAEIACIHPLGRPEVAPFQLFASERADLGLVGEVDCSSIDLFRRTLADVMAGPRRGDQGEVTIDARHLTFLDHRGLAALEEEAGRHFATIVLRTPLSTSQRLVELLELGAVRVEAPV